MHSCEIREECAITWCSSILALTVSLLNEMLCVKMESIALRSEIKFRDNDVLKCDLIKSIESYKQKSMQ